ncbi:MAG: hypothetical protein HUU57_03410 [Bdellovibrio sp.]|nr:hypothetical protein [Bdellovibrio sp.]
MKFLIVILAGMMLLSGCEMEQNPIKGAPDTIVNGKPPEAQKPKPEDPFDKEALQIDAPDFINGRVGSSLGFKIQGRVMVEGLDFDLTIDNLGEFPDAKYDPVTGDFVWTPTKVKVGSANSVLLTLQATLVTRPSEKYPVRMIEKKTIPMTIANTYTQPIVNSVTKPTGKIVVGATYKFPFTIEDIDAMALVDVKVLISECTKSYYGETAVYLAKAGKVTNVPNAPGKYQGEVSVDLSKAVNLVGGRFCFGISTVSKHGVMSDVYDVEFEAEGRMRPTKMTLQNLPDLTVGERMQVSFTIYDPSSLGTLEMISQDDVTLILPGSNFTCNRFYSTKYQIDCSGIFDATTAIPGTYSLKYKVDNVGGYRMVKSTTEHVVSFTVKAANP